MLSKHYWRIVVFLDLHYCTITPCFGRVVPCIWRVGSKYLCTDTGLTLLAVMLSQDSGGCISRWLSQYFWNAYCFMVVTWEPMSNKATERNLSFWRTTSGWGLIYLGIQLGSSGPPVFYLSLGGCPFNCQHAFSVMPILCWYDLQFSFVHQRGK